MPSAVCIGCGTETVARARFCHHCGASVGPGEVDLEIDLFSPSAVSVEPAADANPTDRRRLGPILLLAAVVLLALVFALDGSETPDDTTPEQADPPSPTPTSPASTEPTVDPTPTRAERVSAPALDWTPSTELGIGAPVAFADIGGSTMLFTASGVGPLGVGHVGLDAWRRDAGAWTALGEVIAPPARVTAIASAPDGLVAVGTQADGGPGVWRSPDGVGWEAQRLPADPTGAASGEPERVVVVGDRTIVVGGNRWASVFRVLGTALDEQLGVDLGRYGYNLTGEADGVRLYGPLGVTMLDVTFAELGLTDAEVEALSEAHSGRSLVTTVWSSGDAGEWTTTALDDVAIYGMALLDGEAVAFGQGPTGVTTLGSTDGITWTERGDSQLLGPVQWGDALVGRRASVGLALAVRAVDGDTATIFLDDFLPEGSERILIGVDAGPGGVAAAVDYYDDFSRPTGRTTVATNGFTFTREWSGPNEIVLRDDEGERLRVDGRQPAPTTYTTDITAGTVTFLDPDDGRPLVTVTVDELRILEAPPTADGGRGQLLAVTTDLASWSINWISRFTDEYGFFSETHIDDSHVTVVIATLSSSTARATEEPAYQLFTASLPAG